MRSTLPAMILLAASGASLEAARPVSMDALSAAMKRGGLSNAELANTLRATGVSFALSPPVEQNLKALGADAAVLSAVRESRVAGNVRNSARPLAPVELVVKLFHGSPVTAAAALKSRGAGFDLSPALEAQILEAGGDQALLALAVLRRLEPEPAEASPQSATAETGNPPKAASSSPAAAPQEGSRPIRIDPATQAKKLVRRAEAEYPQLAYRARMKGTVVIEALIGKDGRVRRTRVVRGSEQFQESAQTAVSLYQYKPTLLDETPVEVITEVTVEFDLTKADLGMRN